MARRPSFNSASGLADAVKDVRIVQEKKRAGEKFEREGKSSFGRTRQGWPPPGRAGWCRRHRPETGLPRRFNGKLPGPAGVYGSVHPVNPPHSGAGGRAFAVAAVDSDRDKSTGRGKCYREIGQVPSSPINREFNGFVLNRCQVARWWARCLLAEGPFGCRKERLEGIERKVIFSAGRILDHTVKRRDGHLGLRFLVFLGPFETIETQRAPGGPCSGLLLRAVTPASPGSCVCIRGPEVGLPDPECWIGGCRGDVWPPPTALERNRGSLTATAGARPPWQALARTRAKKQERQVLKNATDLAEKRAPQHEPAKSSSTCAVTGAESI